MNSLPNQDHIKFYDWQIQTLEEQWKRYVETSMQILKAEKRLFVGRIWGFQKKQGNVILRFKRGTVPRMKEFYLLSLVTSHVPPSSDTWDFSYKTFRSSQEPKLSSTNVEIKTKFYLKSTDPKWTFIAVSNMDLNFFSEIESRFLQNDKHPLIVLAETDPPLSYLLNLKAFVESNSTNRILNLNIDKREDEWTPSNIDNAVDVSPKFITSIQKNEITLIQGPPGTGKTYLAAQICNYFLKDNQSIALTALTNKALMEVAEKEGLDMFIEKGKVFKTNLSTDENLKKPKLKSADKLVPQNGELLLITYFKMAQMHQTLSQSQKRFDFLIIEEASQAYLATIAMFSSIAKRILIIGDHKQLSPVVIDRHKAKRAVHEDVDGIIDGLKTFAFNHNDISNRLTKTRRLTSSAAKLTGSFYDNQLSSISPLKDKIQETSIYTKLFHDYGGNTKALLPITGSNLSKKDLLTFMCKIALDLLKNNSKIEIALLAPYTNTESEIYDTYNKLSNDFSRITISTVHKIQGLTVDYTILYLPLRNPSFDVNDNLFNVATSRARKGTLIISTTMLNLLSSMSVPVRSFIAGCEDVTDDFLEIVGN